MSSLFLNLIFQTSQFKVLHLKVRKQGIFLGKFRPSEISKYGDKISDFWVFKIGF